ncbi:MAG: hypothetical protein ABUL72_01220, partial [Armatimonadota bacterium]
RLLPGQVQKVGYVWPGLVQNHTPSQVSHLRQTGIRREWWTALPSARAGTLGRRYVFICLL